MSETAHSLKDRAEFTVLKKLRESRVLRSLAGRKQNEDGKPRLPYLAANATPAGEYAFASGIYRVRVEVTTRFDAKSQAAAAAQDSAMAEIRAKLTELQLAGGTACGVIFEGEQGRFEGDTIRVRSLSVTLVGQ